MRIIQISDTHLSPGKTHFGGNWAPLATWIRAERPDLVIHTGDVTIDGADTEADLAHCAQLMRDLGVPFRVVPGNHDVGDSRHPHQPVSVARLTRWRAHFGPDRWIEDIPGWRLVGIDAMLIGSNLPEEREQITWLAEAMAGAGARRLTWFLHRPLFLDGPDEGDRGYWSVAPDRRRELLALAEKHPPALVASGHLHKAHRAGHGATAYVWGPSSAFLCGAAIQPAMPGEKRLGAVRYDFGAGTMKAEIVAVPGLVEYWIDDLLGEIYPAHSDTRPAAG